MTPFIVTLKKDKSKTGIAISEHVTPLPDDKQQGIIMHALVAVLWDEMRSPAPCYHTPDELEWISVPEIEGDESENEDENEEIEETAEALPEQI